MALSSASELRLESGEQVLHTDRSISYECPSSRSIVPKSSATARSTWSLYTT